MHVKSNPVQHEEVDYAELCARMQSQLASMEDDFRQRQQEMQNRYEAVIRQLGEQVQQYQRGGATRVQATSEDRNVDATDLASGGVPWARII